LTARQWLEYTYLPALHNWIFGFNSFHTAKNSPTNRKLICSNSSMNRIFFSRNYLIKKHLKA
jgi:hypothetical protein